MCVVEKSGEHVFGDTDPYTSAQTKLIVVSILRASHFAVYSPNALFSVYSPNALFSVYSPNALFSVYSPNALLSVYSPNAPTSTYSTQLVLNFDR